MTLDIHTIAERDHEIQNPTSPEKLDRLIDYCRIADGMSVLDIGCGRAWLLRRMAAAYAIDGVGVDTRDAFLDVARAAILAHPPKGALELLAMPALSYPADRGFDRTMCIGAAFAIGTFAEAVDWLMARTKPGGVLAIGDVFALKTPYPQALRDASATASAACLNRSSCSRPRS